MRGLNKSQTREAHSFFEVMKSEVLGLENHSAENYFVQNDVNAIHVEDQIKLADILETLVESLDKHLDQIEDSEFGF